MANTKISALPANNNPTGSEELVYALNNANGKMTLNTMKTFANTGQQAELVSGTNIKTINGDSILGSGNLVIQGGGGGGAGAAYDAVVDASGEGDYTSVGAAIAAGNYNIFVKNGSYTETTGRNPYANNVSFLHIVGESEGGVHITFPSTATTVNGYLIDMRYNNAADFYMENISFDITLTDSNFYFYRDNGGSNFIVKNCSFVYTTNVATPSASKHYLFYTKVISETNNAVEGGRLYSGLFGCYFNTETTKIINICYRPCVANMCKFYSAAGRIQLAYVGEKPKLYNCYVDAFELGGTNLEIYNSYINITGNVYDSNGYNLDIERVNNSIINLGTLQNTPGISLGECSDSELDFGTYDVSGATTFIGMESSRINCKIVCGTYLASRETIGCYIDATGLSISQQSRLIGNRFKNSLGAVTISSSTSVVTGNIFEGTASGGAITISGNNNVFTSNWMLYRALTVTGTGNETANNVKA